MAGETRETRETRVEQVPHRGRTDAAAAPDAPLGQTARRAAGSDCTILLTGETGVGKGYLAKWLHRASPRADAPFVPVNCGAIPESLIDSQLFGHVRGAFSGAVDDHPGLVRTASPGTLFLDEIAELPSSAQTRLLRLLQDREVQPVGQGRPLQVDVRIMAATNGDLNELVRERRFREDLLFRLDVVRIEVRPLRDRPDEFDALLTRFNTEFAELYRQPPLAFDAAALAFMRSFPWPGNIRELRTVMERLHVLCPAEPITEARLIEIGHRGEVPATTARPLETVRYEEVVRILDANQGSVARTAEAFGVHRSTVYRWLRSAQTAS